MRPTVRPEICLWIAVAAVLSPPAARAATGAAPPSQAECFKRASRSAAIAGYSLGKVHRWLHEVALKRIDPRTRLYKADGGWNYRDTAADCYPFLAWAAWATDPEVFEGPVRAVLRAEIGLCSQLDHIPVEYDFRRNAPVKGRSFEQIVFGASEYVKDGLIPIVEVTGKDEWFDRMKAIEEDIWRRAPIETPSGRIPSKNVEVNGEQLQALVRLAAMTGERKFLKWAERLGDHYLLGGTFVPRKLRDHGCEIIGGLGLLLGVESELNPEKARQYLPAFRKMLETILDRGLNPDGLMLNELASKPGRRDGRLSDGWGYNYVAFLCHDMVADEPRRGEPRYRRHIEQTLKNLAKPAYRDYRWEGSSIDGYADAIEGALYLLNRLPVPEALVWADREMAAHVVRATGTLPRTRLWGTHKLESNGVRTTIMHALMHTRGVRALPWRTDLLLGASSTGKGLAVIIKAEKPWTGRLRFDIPRHRVYMGFKHDWPRMNALPEWFTVQPDREYTVSNVGADTEVTYTGKQLHDGLPLELKGGAETRLVVWP